MYTLWVVDTAAPVQVAEKLGVKSLRRMMLSDSAATMSLGLHSVEAFGQSEALTTRLKHIVNDYADGPGILMELLQNADDAGASRVAFLLDNEHYGVNSVLGMLAPVCFLLIWLMSPDRSPRCLRETQHQDCYRRG